MLVEIPDFELIIGVIVAFLLGLGGFYLYFKIHPLLKSKREMIDISQIQRLEYYEKQLIDMKIRLDSFDLKDENNEFKDSSTDLKQILRELSNQKEQNSNLENPPTKVKVDPIPKEKEVVIEADDITDQVLHIITDKDMTSRDIQKSLKRSREHTSRLLKKLYEEGFVTRDTNSKPYLYSISDKGLEKITAR
jgi:hypothetical protein